MKKLSGSKLPVEVKGNMSPEGADRVGMIMTVVMVIDRLWWKVAIVIGLAALLFNVAYANKLNTHLVNTNELTQDETAYACLIAYHPPSQSIKFKCSQVQGQ